MNTTAEITKPIYQKLEEQGITLRNYDEGQHKTTCPQCSPNRKNSRDPCLSVNIDTQGARWRCHHCQWEGNVWKESLQRPPTIRKTAPKKPAQIPNTKSLKGTWGEIFFDERGIGMDVAERYGVGIASHYVGGKRQDCIAFVYKDEQGVPCNIKFRSADKNYAQLPDCERVPYLTDCLNDEGEALLICEGEMDALTWKICDGITENVISVFLILLEFYFYLIAITSTCFPMKSENLRIGKHPVQVQVLPIAHAHRINLDSAHCVSCANHTI